MKRTYKKLLAVVAIVISVAIPTSAVLSCNRDLVRDRYTSVTSGSGGSQNNSSNNDDIQFYENGVNNSTTDLPAFNVNFHYSNVLNINTSYNTGSPALAARSHIMNIYWVDPRIVWDYVHPGTPYGGLTNVLLAEIQRVIDANILSGMPVAGVQHATVQGGDLDSVDSSDTYNYISINLNYRPGQDRTGQILFVSFYPYNIYNSANFPSNSAIANFFGDIRIYAGFSDASTAYINGAANVTVATLINCPSAGGEVNGSWPGQDRDNWSIFINNQRVLGDQTSEAYLGIDAYAMQDCDAQQTAGAFDGEAFGYSDGYNSQNSQQRTLWDEVQERIQNRRENLLPAFGGGGVEGTQLLSDTVQNSGGSIISNLVGSVPIPNTIQNAAEGVQNLVSNIVPIPNAIQNAADSVQNLVGNAAPIPNTIQNAAEGVQNLVSNIVPIPNAIQNAADSVQNLVGNAAPIPNIIQNAADSVQNFQGVGGQIQNVAESIAPAAGAAAPILQSGESLDLVQGVQDSFEYQVNPQALQGQNMNFNAEMPIVPGGGQNQQVYQIQPFEQNQNMQGFNPEGGNGSLQSLYDSNQGQYQNGYANQMQGAMQVQDIQDQQGQNQYNFYGESTAYGMGGGENDSTANPNTLDASSEVLYGLLLLTAALASLAYIKYRPSLKR
ncbi:MAG: methyl-accepting chemotaxis protein [Eubacteriaceae bacterium]|nr:methyl-accepting chemotaxis protein [Eubacteriaceae bacterium]